MKKEALIEFVKTNDFAYVYGAGIAFANDEESREGVTSIIEQDGKIIEEIENIEEEGCGCGNLQKNLLTAVQSIRCGIITRNLCTLLITININAALSA